MTTTPGSLQQIIRCTERHFGDVHIEPGFAFNLLTGAALQINGVDVTSLIGGTPGYINVKSPPYSAIGDGAADDTAAIQAAITAAAGGPIYVPAGTYKITAALTYHTSSSYPPGLHLYGAGKGITIFDDRVVGGYCFDIGSDTSNRFQFGSELRGFTISTPSTKVANCGGIKLKAIWAMAIADVEVDDLTGNGITIEMLLGDNDAAVGITLDRVHVRNCSGIGLFCDGASGHSEIGYLTLRNCDFESCTLGLLLRATNTKISGTAFFTNTATVMSVPDTALAAPAVAPQGVTGATRYDYVVTAITTSPALFETVASAAGTTAIGNAALGVSAFNRITWTLKTGATGYNIYRVFGSTLGLIGTVGAVATFDDIGLAGVTYTDPLTGASLSAPAYGFGVGGMYVPYSGSNIRMLTVEASTFENNRGHYLMNTCMLGSCMNTEFVNSSPAFAPAHYAVSAGASTDIGAVVISFKFARNFMRVIPIGMSLPYVGFNIGPNALNVSIEDTIWEAFDAGANLVDFDTNNRSRFNDRGFHTHKSDAGFDYVRPDAFKKSDVAGGGSYTPDLTRYKWHRIRATSAGAINVLTPTNPVSTSWSGTRWTLTIWNDSVGVIATAFAGLIFTSGFVNPTAGQRTTADFEYDNDKGHVQVTPWLTV